MDYVAWICASSRMLKQLYLILCKAGADNHDWTDGAQPAYGHIAASGANYDSHLLYEADYG